ncbi:hypothetical protein PHYPSEUDO_002702 [Phytophthora pseudosyringae]|uniref:PX domain-containing protein n=1 Tax=Phytophthora pseudosyringae TaxID=221518 RepID=A0A8T1WF38_9STRA|nr:hypothetical protein PHYPSEUDO_002702 [Phytophthora pseudosyringae]
MGCSQSKTSDVVIEPVTAPPSECGKASMDLAFTEIIVDDHEETSTSVPPAPVEEEVEEEEQEVAATELLPVEAVDEPVAVEEEPVAAEETVDVAEAEVPEDEPTVEQEEEEEEQQDPVEPEAEDENEVELQEEKSASVVEKSAATSASAPPVWTFVADQVSFSVGVAFFNMAGSNDEGDEAYVTKRYSEFKALHAEMAQLMTKEELPRMPGTSFLQARNDKGLLQERETVFVQMLNAIAQHPEASQSAPFAAFLA